ncbi:RIP metalloprotease RseP [Paraperlucidibaca wandonensis]|jgi:regulator of sigma E protease|uniref:Zinc metalloprotease n=1 Tax=Paraperlucidibaca wandonensis TaxID=1268273 RepID=A0ABW3HEC0_9GAMM|nr:RIP metalloprotease RseP [Paraperlucidibaca sp.]MBQ0723293.1 RIP metalloprotease RseP [Paraperlucidibaca sp.]MBQ0842699.1 RIP metalloprotease RseP [Paraperlucidibaca sp.]|tara:strand:+ start:2188 stop:3549 length:1362 start_codon:yes stop_codon:yes gene_type:complete
MSFLTIVLAGILVLGPLIAIHEFGHFWVARRCGVQVLTFSIGFGPALWRRTAKDGVEYRLSMIPLGGYVRMLDEREGDVPDALKPRAFNRQSVWARMAIVAAGPAINLLLAVVLYWFLFMQGDGGLRPIVGRVLPDSPAAMAGMQPGDELMRIGERSVNNWESSTYALIDHMGESGKLSLEVRPSGATSTQERTLTLNKYLSGADADPYRELGMLPWTPVMPPIIGVVQEGSPADRAGLQAQDRILRIDGQAIAQWAEIVESIVASPDKAMTWDLVRDGETIVLTVTPELDRSAMNGSRGRLGVGVAEAPVDIPASYRRNANLGPVDALFASLNKTGHLISLSLSSLGKMVTGLIGIDALSGPITIVKVAGQTADIGWQAMLGFMALLSVSLGVLNLLPIPVLDGGHLLYYAIEAVWRRPLPEAVQQFGLRVGVAIMGSVMLLAILNDIRRLF